MFQFLFSSKGRVSRLQYNIYFMVPFMVLNWLMYILPSWFQYNLDLLLQISIVTTILSIFLLYSFIVVTNKRFHDREVSGWRQLGYFLISLLGGVIFYLAVDLNLNPAAMTFSYTVNNMILSKIGQGLFFVPMIIMVIELCVLKGKDGLNKYGPDPLAITE